jgi:hypothetical protein
MVDVTYEPDGNVPPDFSCRGKVAVEVRRLNQHDPHGRGLEESTFPLAMKFRHLLISLGPSQGASWFVSFRYRRPLEAWTTLERKITLALSAFRSNPRHGIVHLAINERFELALIRSEEIHTTCFVVGGYSDHDSGGWVASETIRNLAIVIPQKSKKVEHFRKNYDKWWLVLIDHIAHARLEADELSALREYIKRPPEWAKIFLVNPNAPDRAIEL